MGLFIFSCLALLGTWFFWAKHEKLNTAIKNLARTNEDKTRKSDKVQGEVNNRDTYEKITAGISQFILILVISLYLTEYVFPGNVAIVVAFILYGFASRWFFFELIYNISIGKSIYYIGTGPSKLDKFFGSLLNKGKIFFYIKLGAFILSIIGLLLAATEVVKF